MYVCILYTDADDIAQQTLETASNSNEPLAALGPTTGSMLCEAVKTFIANAADVRAGVANAENELLDMQSSTVMCQTAMLKVFSAKTNVTMKKEVTKCKLEFERGKVCV